MLKKFFLCLFAGALLWPQFVEARIHPSPPLQDKDQVKVLAEKQLVLQPVVIRHTVNEGDLATVTFNIPTECYSAWANVQGTMENGPSTSTLIKGANEGSYIFGWQTRAGDGRATPYVATAHFIGERSVTVKLYVTVLAPTPAPMSITGITPTTANVTVQENTVNYFAVDVVNVAGTLTAKWSLTDPQGKTEVVTQSETATTLSFNYDDAGVWAYAVQVTDGTTTVNHIWSITVVNVPRPMAVNIVGVGNAVVNHPVGIDFIVNNPEGYILTYGTTFQGGVFSNLNADTKTLTWTPTVVGGITGNISVYGGDTEAVATTTVTVVAGDTTTNLIRLGTEVRGGVTYFAVTFPTGTGWDLGVIKPRAVPVSGDWTWANGLTPSILEGQKVLWNTTSIEKCWFQVLYLEGTNTRGMDGNNVHPADQAYLTNCDPTKGLASYCWSVHLPTCP